MDNIKIIYLCDRKNHCNAPCYELCKHTTNLEFAKNYKRVPPLLDLGNSSLFEALITENEITEFWEIDSEDPVGIL
jgi:hypothetical protein